MTMMPLSLQNFQNLQYEPDNNRLILIISKTHHEQQTLKNLLNQKARLKIYICTDLRISEYSGDYRDHNVYYKPFVDYLYYEKQVDIAVKKSYLVNLIDQPHYIDYSQLEAASFLRIADGAILVVDYNETIQQTEPILRQILQERIKAVLLINNIDLSIDNGEQIYQNLYQKIQTYNVVISTYQNQQEGIDFKLNPEKGNVAFGSVDNELTFTLDTFARVYSGKLNLNYDKMMELLWGDNFFDEKSNQWKTEGQSDHGQPLQRGFVQFIMEPIIRLHKAIDESDRESLNKVLDSIEIHLTTEEQELTGNQLYKLIFSRWLNAAENILDMVVTKLPSPVEAQKYRAAYLYTGPIDDPCGKAIQNCDQNGPLMVFISQMVPTNDNDRLYAFGRVFSGRVQAGQNVRIMGQNYNPGSKTELFIKTLQKPIIFLNGSVQNIPIVPCGNLVGLIGIDQYLTKQGTISDYEDAYQIQTQKFSISPVVRVNVEPKNPSDLPKLIEGLRRLSKVNKLVNCLTEESGEHVIAANDEILINRCVKELIEDFSKCEVNQSSPYVLYQETVMNSSNQICLAKSPNKHSRLYGTAQPLGDELADAIELEYISSKQDHKILKQKLCDRYGWDINDVNQIWCFGPDNTGPNILINKSKELRNINEIKEAVMAGFNWCSTEGILCESQMRGVQCNLIDATLCADALHRGGGQIIPATRRLFYASQLTAEPRLVEPIYLCEIQVTEDSLDVVYKLLAEREANIDSEELDPNNKLLMIKSYMAVSNSFGFVKDLKIQTQGKAMVQQMIHHWEVINSDPFDVVGKANQLIEIIRKRKGLRPGIPELSLYLDKL